MFLLRDRHLAALRAANREAFVARVVERVHVLFPTVARALGAEGVRALVRDGVERATRYGFWRERDAAAFVDLLFGIDPAFEQLPSMAWARAILEDAVSPGDRIARIHAELLARGPGTEHPVEG